jgi:peptidoglycan/LPS O-acetylase OafA/YrhL
MNVGTPAVDLLSESVADHRRHVRLSILVAAIVAVVVLTVVFSHGIRVRFIWGASGFVAGLICGVLLTLEVQHRWRSRRR